MRTIELSQGAMALLHRRLCGERVEITEESRPPYEELVDAGMMEPIHTFGKGARGHYRLTEAALRYRDALNGNASPLPSCCRSSCAAWLIGRVVSGPAIRASS